MSSGNIKVFLENVESAFSKKGRRVYALMRPAHTLFKFTTVIIFKYKYIYIYIFKYIIKFKFIYIVQTPAKIAFAYKCHAKSAFA